LVNHLKQNFLVNYGKEMDTDRGFLPIVAFEVPTSGEKRFSWRMFYSEWGSAFSEPLMDQKQETIIEEGRIKIRRVENGTTVAANPWLFGEFIPEGAKCVEFLSRVSTQVMPAGQCSGDVDQAGILLHEGSPSLKLEKPPNCQPKPADRAKALAAFPKPSDMATDIFAISVDPAPSDHAQYSILALPPP